MIMLFIWFQLIFSLGWTLPNPPPNIIVLVTDDQRWDALGYAGNPIIHTPEQDRLAQEGTYFKRAFSTTPICAASRASILTGMYERTHGYTFGPNPLDSIYNQKNYAFELKKNGYKTGFFGKLGIFHDGNLTQSFSEFEVYDRNTDFKDQRGYFYKTLGRDTVHLTRYTGQKALDFIENTSKEQPFCLSISFSAPHAHDGAWEGIQKQYFWQKDFDEYYADLVISNAPTDTKEQFDALPPKVKEGMNRTRWHWRFDTPEKYQESIKGYYRMISGVDRELGLIRALLQKKGIADNTIIIWIGDNGYFLGDKQLAGKWLMYDHAIGVPLMIYDPRVNQHYDVEDMVANIDLFPTIMEYAKITQPPSSQGNSLVSYVATGQSQSKRKELLIEHLWDFDPIPSSEGLRTDRWKFLRYRNIVADYELYDLINDPEETTNLALSPEYSEKVQEMTRQLEAAIRKYGPSANQAP